MIKMNNSRIMGLDIGDVRIGIALSDLLGITAQGQETYTRTGDDEADADPDEISADEASSDDEILPIDFEISELNKSKLMNTMVSLAAKVSSIMPLNENTAIL